MLTRFEMSAHDVDSSRLSISTQTTDITLTPVEAMGINLIAQAAWKRIAAKAASQSAGRSATALERVAVAETITDRLAKARLRRAQTRGGPKVVRRRRFCGATQRDH